MNVGSGQTPDPATVDFPIFYVKRTIPEDTDDLRQLRDTVADADLFKRDRASPGALETNITERVTGDTDLYDIKDVDVSFDGKKVVFAMRGPLDDNQDEEDPPTWEIWEYDIAADDLHRVIASDTVAGEGNDVSPHYLPDGRIVFSSTRQRAVEGDPARREQAAVRGADRRPQRSRVRAARDERRRQRHQADLVQPEPRPAMPPCSRTAACSGAAGTARRATTAYIYIRPTRTARDLQLLYGANSHNTGTDDEPAPSSSCARARCRTAASSRSIRANTDADFGGDLVIIDTNTYVENTQPTLANAGMTGPGADARHAERRAHDSRAPRPAAASTPAFPLWDGTNRILTTWSQCRLLDATTTPATIVPCTDDAPRRSRTRRSRPSIYSVWMFDPGQNTLLPIMTPTEDVMITDVVAAQPRARCPPVILDKHARASTSTPTS